MDNRYSLRCDGHNYVTLSWDGRFIFCLDNSLFRMEQIIEAVEKRTNMRFQDVRREDSDDSSWDGLRFATGFKKASEWMR